MTKTNIRLNKKKRNLIKINNIKDFIDALKSEGYNINEFNNEKFKEEITKVFKIDNSVTEILYKCINDAKITYRAKSIKDFIDYIEKIMLFESEHEKLCGEIKKMKKLNIERVEYERKISSQDNVEGIIKDIEEIKTRISSRISETEKVKLDNIEKELDKDNIYSNDIELLKKMICVNKDNVKERYNDETQTKTILIEIPKEINYKYIKPKKGTIEYHQHLSSNIPRMQRLRNNMYKYMEAYEKESGTFRINQSKLLQDTINIAVGIFNNKEFKAISGNTDAIGYCKSRLIEEEVFKSSKVNKLGELGVGYNRINDSEKKIIEEIHKQIESKILRDEGNLILYSKWEPCSSCYFVIVQFLRKHPNIKVQVKYSKKYGEC
ncbi:deaminase domain-containing protein [Clostridium sp.]|uniref:deaminase domain-containing protein n=1 Tax=Clostridium sp. TaxID=1506 RepID=UPI0026257A78|nr:deaminase domain-containing protein [Clostridium sp.]